MKLTATRSALLSALIPAVAITNRRSPHPFGACVVLRAAKSGSNNGLTVQASNQTTNVRATLDADVLKPGDVSVPAQDLLDRIEAMPDGPLSLAIAKDKLTIAAGARVYVLRTLSAEHFPAFPAAPPAPVVLPAKALAEVLCAVAYAQGESLDVPMFCGVALAAKDGALTATASDSKRIARATMKVESDALATFIPSKAVDVLLRVLGASGDVSIASSDSLVYVRVGFGVDKGGAELAYQRPSVAAPAYDAVMAFLKAKDGPAVDRRALQSALKAVTVDGTSGNVPVVVSVGGGLIRLSHTSLDGDVSTDEVQVDTGEWDWTAAAEAKYLLDALSHLHGDTVRLFCWEEDLQQPIVVRDELGGVATIARIDPKKKAESVREAA